MKKLIVFWVLVLGLVWNVNAQAEKTLVKSVALAASTEAIVELPGTVEMAEWDKDFIRVTSTINIVNFDESIAKRLVIVGRYSLESVEKEGILYITMPKANMYVSIKGTDLQENLTFKVQAPEGYNVIIKDMMHTNNTKNTTTSL